MSHPDDLVPLDEEKNRIGMARSQRTGNDRSPSGCVGNMGGVVFLLAGIALGGVGAYEGAYAAG